MELELEPLNFPSDQERPCVIAGPCSAETEEQVMTTAKQLAAKGCHMFRAGVWKPRTKPGGFEGNGEHALPWMKQVKEETGMLTATEVATPEHVELALKYGIDILWVGARTSANPFAMQALADSLQGVDVPVLVKNPVNPDLELWIGALQRINQAGIKKLGAIHRGFSSIDREAAAVHAAGVVGWQVRRVAGEGILGIGVVRLVVAQRVLPGAGHLDTVGGQGVDRGKVEVGDRIRRREETEVPRADERLEEGAFVAIVAERTLARVKGDEVGVRRFAPDMQHGRVGKIGLK